MDTKLVVTKGVRTDRKLKKKNYTEEFKQQAIELAASLRSTSEAARQLGISDGSIHAVGWLNLKIPEILKKLKRVKG